MNSKERVLRAIAHQETDRVPFFYLGGAIDPAVAQKLGIQSTQLSFLEPGHLDLIEGLGGDICFVWPRFAHGPSRRAFSCDKVHAAIHEGKVVCEKMPLEDAESVDEILNYKQWPHPDWYDYPLPSWIRAASKNKAICAYDMGILFLHASGMRGMETLMMDMAANPEIAHAIFGKISAHNLERMRRFLTINKGFIDIMGIGDDVAGQEGLLFSLKMWREYIKPHLQKAVALCRDFGVVPYFHGCGGFRELFPDFIEMGIPCVGRLQPAAKGNNFHEIKCQHGKQLCLWGAIDAQHVVIEKTPVEVREHVKNLVETGGCGGGFIAGPSHSFTTDTPVENVLAVYEVLRAEKRRITHK
ncbi:MAG: uroporphyrinogen decarboxylase family protein [Verrucomicrobiae bacterium]|nr:uroporphyrinogen decarboxylase family protein [Verrucomicrobiae bacterium]